MSRQSNIRRNVTEPLVGLAVMLAVVAVVGSLIVAQTAAKQSMLPPIPVAAGTPASLPMLLGYPPPVAIVTAVMVTPTPLTTIPETGDLPGLLFCDLSKGWVIVTDVGAFKLLGDLPDQFDRFATSRIVIMRGNWDSNVDPLQRRYTPTCIQEAWWAPHGDFIQGVGGGCGTAAD